MTPQQRKQQLARIGCDTITFFSAPRHSIDRIVLDLMLVIHRGIVESDPYDTELQTELYFIGIRLWVIARERGTIGSLVRRYLSSVGDVLGVDESRLIEYGIK